MEREIIGYLKKIPYSLEQLRKKSRKRDLLYHRFVAMYLLREKGYTFEMIAEFFNRGHATVIHACNQVEDAIEGYNPFLLRIYDLACDVQIETRILCKPTKFKLKILRNRQ